MDAGPPPQSRGRVASLLAVLLLLGVGSLVLDRSARERGAEDVADCRELGAGEIAAAYDLLAARTGTVRPTVFALPEGDVRNELLGLVSAVVADADDRLLAARDRCTGVELLWHHGDLARRRDDCVAALEDSATWFREVSVDGAHAFGGGFGDRGGCA